MNSAMDLFASAVVKLADKAVEQGADCLVFLGGSAGPESAHQVVINGVVDILNRRGKAAFWANSPEDAMVELPAYAEPGKSHIIADLDLMSLSAIANF